MEKGRKEKKEKKKKREGKKKEREEENQKGKNMFISLLDAKHSQNMVLY